MSTKYREFTGLNLPAIEKEVLERWSAHQAFEKSVSLREGATPFVFYEGPPSANGMPGIHHVISRTLKDMVCRYKTMQGFQVKRKGGWDTHGLPVELGVEKELGITKEDIGVKISVAEYNKACREAVLRYKDKWDTITRKMGYWVDLQHPYITFESSYIETLWWLLSELYKKGLLYESVSIQPYSPAAGTGLSSHELNQPGTYKDVKDTSCVAMFKLEQSDRSQFLFDQLKQQDQRPEASTVSNDIYLLAWTTTPWTLPSNLGLTVGAQIEYALVSTINPYTFLPVNVVLATALLSKYFKPEGENQPIEAGQEKIKILPWKILSTFSGAQLEECHYQQLLPFEANSPAAIEANTPGARPFRVLTDSFVTTQDGTGIVHTAPAFGADDYKVGQKYGIGLLTLVDREGKFINGVGEFSGRYVKDYKNEPGYVDVNIDISVKLKKENRAFKVEKYEHSYPHCWRTDKPILYYPLDAWFIRTTALRDRMVALNKTIQWKPASTGEGRFGNWLENMVDWNLSRSRFWGTPLPIWRTEDGEETICIGSIAQLKEEIARSVAAGHEIGNCKKDAPDLAARIDAVVSDLHKPYVDEIVLVSASGKPMRRVPDLIDVWFDSGAMPYAQWGLPDTSSGKYGPLSPENFFRYHALNKNSGADEHSFPASFIAEGVDQTRGWFYTLHAIAGLLFDSVAYQTVVSNGLVLDKNGNKMSKRLGNVVDPFATIDSFGADATRWYLITNASPWDNLRFDSEGIREVQRKFFGTLYNTYQFFVLYANVDGFTYKEAPIASNDRPEIDRWILSCLHTLTARVTTLMNEYEPTAAGRLLEDFVDEQLSNWYVRLCRRRFWKGEYSQDKIAAYQTLYECMETVLRLMAPISPFFSDALFNELNTITGRHSQQSVHHVLYPVADENYIDRPLEERMQLAQDASSLVLSLRKKVNIKVRQPLQKVLIPVLDTSMQSQLEAVEALIKAEVNVKEISYLQADNTFISKKIKPNFVALGKKLGSKMKAVSAALASFSQAEIAQLEKEGQYTLSFEEGPVTLLLSDTDITSEDIPGWTVASKGKLTVALDITITPELAAEGIAREFVNRIQKIRKDAGFELTDKILVQVMAPASLTDALANFKAYICAEILAEKLEFQSSLSQATAIDINDEIINVLVTKNG
ncbi:MAG: isoleucine--tRNA ligase [Sphingomonadales bacterium]